MAIRRFFRFWFPVLLYSGIIFYVSSWESIDVPLSYLNFDKVIHIFEYVPFGFLLTRAYIHTINIYNKKIILLSIFFISLLYGMSDEFHQFFVPGRSASLFDMMADSLGGTLGCWIYQSLNQNQNSR